MTNLGEKQKILILGYGSVAQCTLPILEKHLKLPLAQVTVLDKENKKPLLEPWIQKGISYHQLAITQENLTTELSRFLSAGDILVDLAWNIDCCEILQWCHDHGVRYLNTSVEVWDPYDNEIYDEPHKKTLYWRHQKVRAMTSRWREPGPTAVLEHGANPGLISHFTKQALLDIASKGINDSKWSGARLEKISQFSKTRNFPELAKELGVKVIHCSERDTQISNLPKRVNEFVNTWSVEGFREEGTTTAEMGWGTHEKWMPEWAFTHPEGPKNQIGLAAMGINTWVRSWVPGHEIRGMVVRHGEAYTISNYLTVWNGGEALYRPTVHYAYNPCDTAIASLNELRGYDYQLQSSVRIMNDEITDGADILGALVMGHDYQSWWTGSHLTIEESRQLIPHQNATTMQVAIAVVAGVQWMIENPNQGVVVPEDLPHDFVLEIARPYLGQFISVNSDWTPLKHKGSLFEKNQPSQGDKNDPWQFSNFLVRFDD